MVADGRQQLQTAQPESYAIQSLLFGTIKSNRQPSSAHTVPPLEGPPRAPPPGAAPLPARCCAQHPPLGGWPAPSPAAPARHPAPPTAAERKRTRVSKWAGLWQDGSPRGTHAPKPCGSASLSKACRSKQGQQGLHQRTLRLNLKSAVSCCSCWRSSAASESFAASRPCRCASAPRAACCTVGAPAVGGATLPCRVPGRPGKTVPSGVCQSSCRRGSERERLAGGQRQRRETPERRQGCSSGLDTSPSRLPLPRPAPPAAGSGCESTVLRASCRVARRRRAGRAGGAWPCPEHRLEVAEAASEGDSCHPQRVFVCTARGPACSWRCNKLQWAVGLRSQTCAAAPEQPHALRRMVCC